MINNRLHIIFFLIAAVLWSEVIVWAQPATLSVNSQTLSRTGYNSSGASTGFEYPDSVTIGSTTRYYVTPDAGLNPSYTAVLTGTLDSGFGWSLTGGGSGAGTISAINGYANYRQIQWTATGSKTVTAIETSVASCAGNAVTTDALVIAAPTVSFSTSGGSASLCVSGVDGSLSVTMPSPTLNISFTSAVSGKRNMNLQYDINGPAGFTPVTNHLVNITETGAGTGTITVSETFTHFGAYTITLKDAGDRIANKGNNFRNTAGITNPTYTFWVLNTPTTSPNKHVTNIGW